MTALRLMWAALLALALWDWRRHLLLNRLATRQDAVTTAAMNAEGHALAAKNAATEAVLHGEHAKRAVKTFGAAAFSQAMLGEAAKQIPALEARIEALEAQVAGREVAP